MRRGTRAQLLFACAAAGLMVQFGCAREERKSESTVVPELASPIKITSGAVFSDGGSVEVDLLGANGARLPLTIPVNFDPKEPSPHFIAGALYIGRIDDVADGKGTRCPVPSSRSAKIASYLESAIHEIDPDYDSRWTSRSRAFGKGLSMELGCAKLVLRHIRQIEAEANEPSATEK